MKVSGISRVVGLILGGLFLVPTLLLSQSGNQGAVEGTVSDFTGAVLPGVMLQVRSAETSFLFSTQSTEEGLFRFLVPIGTYRLTAERQGFATLTRENVPVTVGARINLSLTMAVGGQAESVNVSEQAPLVETTRSQFSTVMDQHSVAELPVNGRNFADFIVLTPGVTRDARPSLSDVSFGGLRVMNLLLVDGADDNNVFFNNPVGRAGGNRVSYQFSLSAIQEFQVNTNSYSAEIGRAGGGITNAITKSGTNNFHGETFWFYRDRSMNATDLINQLVKQPKSPFHFNQFGGSLGGPIRKSKLFFFGNYEGQRSTASNVTFLNLPPGFTFSTDPRVAGFQKLALDYLSARAAPWIQTFDQNIGMAKIDWQLRPAHLLSARWNRQSFDGQGNEAGSFTPGALLQTSRENTGETLLKNDSLALSLASSLSPSTVNVGRVNYLHDHQGGLPYSNNPQASVSQGGQTVLNVGRLAMEPAQRDIRSLQLADTVTLSRGRHSLKFGVDLLRERVPFVSAVNFSGAYRFRSLESFGRSLAGMPAPATGEQYVQSFSNDGSHGAHLRQELQEWSGFAEDEWRPYTSLTLNLGLRYDLQSFAQPKVRNLAPSLLAAGIDTSVIPIDRKNVAPRVGFAWMPFGLQNTVVRGGYGIFYSRTPVIMSNKPFLLNGVTVQTRTLQGGTPTAALIPAYPRTLCGPPDPSGLPPNCAAPAAGVGNPTIFVFSPDYQQPMIQQASFGVERQVRKDLAISASYLWVKGTHIERAQDINLALPEPPATIPIAGTSTLLSYQKFTLPRPITGFDRILEYTASAASAYNALVLQVKRRLGHGFQIQGSYTFSKVIDDNGNFIVQVASTEDSKAISDSTNPRADRGLGDNDITHRLILYGIWQLDYGKKLPQWTSRIVRGWELSGILNAQSGLPYSGMLDLDLNNDGNSNNDRTPEEGRNIFRLPATAALDARVSRRFSIGERGKVQVIWEAFNLFNQPNAIGVRNVQHSVSSKLSDCGAGITQCLVPQSSFGTPTATSGPRTMQLGAKISF